MAGPYESWTPDRGSRDAEVRALLQAVMGLHSTYREEIWLWRGQASASFALEPAMHTRLRKSEHVAHEEPNVKWAAADLIRMARERKLDAVDDLVLPDLALLAHLQHHGAATPLLDVTVDPLVALWMVVNANATDPSGSDGEVGHLFALRRPPDNRWIDPLDSRPYWSQDMTSALFLRAGIHWYRPPDISERLRIQRGSFVLGPYVPGKAVTIPIAFEGGDGWLTTRIKQLGKQGKPGEGENGCRCLSHPSAPQG